MTKFTEALQEGIKAAEDVRKSKNEIDDVFIEVNSQLQAGYNGKLYIFRDSKSKTVRVKLPRGLGGIMFGSDPEFETNTVQYWAIMANNPKNEENQELQLALWEPSETGYPCEITVSDVDHRCEDREALEDALLELLKNPSVAEKLLKLMNPKQ